MVKMTNPFKELTMNLIQSNRKVLLFEGILFFILGIMAVALPVVFTIGFELLIGWLFIIGGGFQTYRVLTEQHKPGFIWSLLTALLYIIFGVLLIAYPIAGALSLTLLLTFFFILEGLTKIVLAFKIRPFRNWGWMLFSGLISLFLAAVIWSGWPESGLWVIGLLVGINMVFFGLSLIFMGLGTHAPLSPIETPDVTPTETKTDTNIENK